MPQLLSMITAPSRLIHTIAIQLIRTVTLLTIIPLTTMATIMGIGRFGLRSRLDFSHFPMAISGTSEVFMGMAVLMATLITAILITAILITATSTISVEVLPAGQGSAEVLRGGQ